MQLTLKDTAKLLNLPERTIHRWVLDNQIPVCRVNDQIRFNRTELLEWATARGLPLSPEIIAAPVTHATKGQLLSEAIVAGGIVYDLAGDSREEVLQGAVGALNLPEGSDRELLTEILLAREALASTAISRGVAVPHVRNPIILELSQPVVGLAFLREAVDFKALDGLPVNTLFTMISPTVRIHLYLLSRLTFILRDVAFERLLAQRAAPALILERIRALEKPLEQAKGGEATQEGLQV